VAPTSRTDIVRRFYNDTPFPNYPPHDSVTALRARAERSRFAQLLDRAIPAGARVVEIGCGTGQMSVYLGLANRLIIAADISRSALGLGHDAARRCGVASVHFVETDLHDAGLKEHFFDIVYAAGVLHHTADPAAAFASVARLARPGGTVIVGVYNAVARLPLRCRRAIARLTRFHVIPFDPILRERSGQAARREAWLRDQYQHPEEHRHTIAEVKRWFAANDIRYLRSFPSTVFGDDGSDLFAPAIDAWTFEEWLAQIGWMWTLGHEGGLFFAIGRRLCSSLNPVPTSDSKK
jgi:ubiquinone/menaquinone biosynthesis C-methylase UbiE